MNTVSQSQRDQLLTEEVIRRSARVRDPLETTILYRDDRTVCLKYARPKTSLLRDLTDLSLGTVGGILVLSFHILLICISLGLWLVVLLLLGMSRSKKDENVAPGLEIISIDENGVINTRRDSLLNEKTVIKKLRKAAKAREKKNSAASTRDAGSVSAELQ
ncbi:hypothetical protein ACUW97_000806 [Kocuria rhizophila]